MRNMVGFRGSRAHTRQHRDECRDLGAGMGKSSFLQPALTATYKLKKGRLAASAAVTDQTVAVPINQKYVPLCKGPVGDLKKFKVSRDNIIACPSLFQAAFANTLTVTRAQGKGWLRKRQKDGPTPTALPCVHAQLN